MTAFRERDLIKVTQDGATRWNGGIRLTRGMIVRVKEVGPGGLLVKIYSSLLDANHLEAWWDVNRFELHEAARPVQPRPEALTGRDRATELLNEAETKRRQGEGYHRVQTPALLGILYTLLDEPRSEVQDLVRQLEEEWKARNKLREQLDESWSEREALRHRVDELETERDDLKEKAEILEAELLVAKNHVRAAREGEAAAKEEIIRLNREQGIVPTREEAVAETKRNLSKVAGFDVAGNDIVITDSDDDVVELGLVRDEGRPSLYVSEVSRNGAYINPEQFQALSRHYDRWVNQKAE